MAARKSEVGWGSIHRHSKRVNNSAAATEKKAARYGTVFLRKRGLLFITYSIVKKVVFGSNSGMQSFSGWFTNNKTEMATFAFVSIALA
jgi:hypothetical protein